MRFSPAQKSTRNRRFASLFRPAATIAMLAWFAATNCSTAAVGQEASKQSGIDLTNVSKDLAPGGDFYQYVNDKWLQETEIPGDQSDYGAFTALDDAAKQDVRVLLEAAAAKGDEADGIVKQAGSLYASYMNTELRNQLGMEPLEGLLESIRSVESKEEWTNLAAQLSRIGVNNPMGYYVEPNAKKSTQYAAYVVQSGITLPDRDYYLEDQPRYVAFRGALLSYSTALLGKANYSDAAELAKSILEFEKKIATVQWTNTKLRDPIATHNVMDVQEFASSNPELNWIEYSAIVDLPTEGEVIIGQPSFFNGLNAAIAETDLEVLKAYSAFHLLDYFADTLNEELVQLHFEFHRKALKGVTEQEPLWKRGVQLCNGLLGMPVGQLYVKEHFSPDAKSRMVELVDNLKLAFSKRIDALEWMGNGTKQRAKEKLGMIATKIGYPDVWKDYSSVQINRDDLFGNILAIAEFEHVYNLSKLGEPVDRNEWHMPPQTVNAYYSPLTNEIVFPAAILQPPFFNMKADDAVNYGAIGAVIGHEISHAFDDSGSEYDGHGNLRDWWTEQDRKEFEARAKKLVAQYEAYKPFDDANLNGELTLGENIGDLGGLTSAFTAYQLSLEGKKSPVIDGLTGEQRFFMGWAQVWRRKYREPELRRRLLTDPHSPSQYRANGIVSNMDGFYEAFTIKPDEAMYIAPKDRIRIW